MKTVQNILKKYNTITGEYEYWNGAYWTEHRCCAIQIGEVEAKSLKQWFRNKDIEIEVV